jgi:hypothetical protein
MEKMCDMYMCSEWSEARRLLLPLSFNFTVYHQEYAKIQGRIRMNGNMAAGDAGNFPDCTVWVRNLVFHFEVETQTEGSENSIEEHI